MSALAVKYSSEPEQATLNVATPQRFPSSVPVHFTFPRSLIASTIVHLAVIGGAFSASFAPNPPPEVVATPVDRALDVSVIPISALETLLPKGVSAVPPLISTPASAAPSLVQPPAPLQPQIKQPLGEKPRKRVRKEYPKKSTPISSSPSAAVAQPRQESDSSLPSRASSPAQSSGKQLSAQPFGVPDGESISLERARISYQDAIATRLARVKRYPERALRRRTTGEGTIRLEISSDGSVNTVQILRSTNAAILDEEIRAMVDRAAPFPAFPADLKENKLALIVPIAFRLEG